jgi:hypothetical protein
MDLVLKERFSGRWERYFAGAELPIVFYYSDDTNGNTVAAADKLPGCLIAALARVRRGHPLCLDRDSIGCLGGRRYLGFTGKLRPDFEYFLSCGIPGKITGERYKQSPELVREVMKHQPFFPAPGRFIVFKRWDSLETGDNPDVVIFFASPDVITGLFTLANFDESEPDGVFTPFGSGSASIIRYPYMEKTASRPRGVIGMFDISARTYVPKDRLSFAVPFVKFQTMVANMEASFLTTESWAAICRRIA